MSDLLPDPDSNIPRLSLRLTGAARALSISPRLLADLTKQGVIPHIRVSDRVILYPVDPLRRWLDEQASKGGTIE